MENSEVEINFVGSKSRYAQLIEKNKTSKPLVVTIVTDESAEDRRVALNIAKMLNQTLAAVKGELREPAYTPSILYVRLPVSQGDNHQGVGYPLGFSKIVKEVPSLHFETTDGKAIRDCIEGARVGNMDYLKLVTEQALRKHVPAV